MKSLIRTFVALAVLLVAALSVFSLSQAQEEKPISLDPITESGDTLKDSDESYVELGLPSPLGTEELTIDEGLSSEVESREPSSPEATSKTYVPLILNPPLTVVNNGNFEAGNTSWQATSTTGRTLIRTSFAPTSVSMHGGAWGAWLGGRDYETSALQQTISIQPGSTYLTYWHWIGSSDYCGYDFARIKLNGVTVVQYNLCSSTNTGGWVKKVFNLSAYAGQTVALRIEVKNDYALNSNLFIDDIKFQSTP